MLKNHREIKGRFRKRVVLGGYPRSGFRSGETSERTLIPVFRCRGTSECTLVPVFVPGGTSAKTPLLETTLLGCSERKETIGVAQNINTFRDCPRNGCGSDLFTCFLFLGGKGKHTKTIPRKSQENAGTVPGKSWDNPVNILLMRFHVYCCFLALKAVERGEHSLKGLEYQCFPSLKEVSALT